MNADTHKPIRSFMRRQGRLTSGQANALNNFWSTYGLSVENGLIDYDRLFQTRGHRVLEIGYGMGSSLVAMASAFPTHQFIGIEVHKPGVGSLINQTHQLQLSNIKTYADDAQQVISVCIPNEHLDTIQIFFPDPWQKRKHHKRRLIQPALIEALRFKLKLGGKIHIATDWHDYAKHILATLQSNTHYTNCASDECYSPRPDYRPETKFESRGHKLGHGIWDIIFERCI